MRDLKEEGEERDGEGVKIYGGIEGKERGNKGQREKKKRSGYLDTSICTLLNDIMVRRLHCVPL